MEIWDWNGGFSLVYKDICLSMKITDSLSQFLKSPEKRSNRFRTSKFPKVYLGEDFKSKITTIKAYYKILDTPTDCHKKIHKSRSPVKIFHPRHIKFAFRSHSSSKLLSIENLNPIEKPPQLNLRYFRSPSKSKEKSSNSCLQKNFSDLIRVSSAKG